MYICMYEITICIYIYIYVEREGGKESTDFHTKKFNICIGLFAFY